MVFTHKTAVELIWAHISQVFHRVDLSLILLDDVVHVPGLSDRSPRIVGPSEVCGV